MSDTKIIYPRTANLQNEVSTELEAAEIERIYGETPIHLFDNHDVIVEVYKRILKRFRSIDFGLEAVFFMGYIYGQRAERKRRKGKCQTVV